jgi:hypothetical protein
MADRNNEWKREEDDEGDQEIDETVSTSSPTSKTESETDDACRATRRRKMPFFWPLK